MAREVNEVSFSSSYDELQNAFDELHDEFLKIAKALTSSKKKNLSLEKKLEKEKEENNLLIKTKNLLEKQYEDLKHDYSVLQKEHVSHKEKITKTSLCECENLIKEKEELTNTLAKFTKGRDTLNVLLGK